MFNVKGDMKPIIKHLNKTQKKQIPFAAAQAINTTLFEVMRAEKKQMPQKLDRPMPKTVKAIRVLKAKKTELYGEVFVNPEHYKYLKYAIEGGTRASTKKIGVPTKHAKLNKFGNITKRNTGLIKNKNQFIGKINGVSGVWERSHYNKKGNFTSAGKSRSTNLKLIIRFYNTVDYDKQFPFYKIADKLARKKFLGNFQKSLKRALDTAR